MTMMEAATFEGFITDVAQRLMPGGDPAPIRAVMARMADGGWVAPDRDGRRASTLTRWGTPLEVSVTGGRERFSPSVRYIVEAATYERTFDSRLAAQMRILDGLSSSLPGAATAINLYRTFVRALYPDPAAITPKLRSTIGIGVVHDPVAPHQLDRLKVYGGLGIVPGAIERLCRAFPRFSGLAANIPKDRFLRPYSAALEVDCHGILTYKIYLRSRIGDVAVPMKLTRLFGEPAWEILAEFARGGIDPAQFCNHEMFVCLAEADERRGFAVQLSPRASQDLSRIAVELASRHYGTSAPLYSLADAAASHQARWCVSGIALGSSGDRGIDKLNIYGVPLWEIRREGLDAFGSGIDDQPLDAVGEDKSAAEAGAARPVGVASPSAATDRSDVERAVAAACNFLLQRQDVDGYWRDFFLPAGRSDAWVTGCVGVALDLAREHVSGVLTSLEAIDAAASALQNARRPKGWGYNGTVACDADSTSWVLRFLARRVKEPESLGEVVRRYRTSAGGIQTFASRYSGVYGSWADEHDEVSPAAGIALLALGDHAAADAVRSRVVDRHRQYGRWQNFWWLSNAYATAQNLSFLSRDGGVPVEIASTESRRLARCLEHKKGNLERGEVCPFEVSQYLTAAIHSDASECVGALRRALLACQQDDGGWLATELAVPSRWNDSVAVFKCDRRLFITAMAIISLLETGLAQ